jgi:hypothetical protein
VSNGGGPLRLYGRLKVAAQHANFDADVWTFARAGTPHDYNTRELYIFLLRGMM